VYLVTIGASQVSGVTVTQAFTWPPGAVSRRRYDEK
jgi:hypothetical protein